MLPPSENVNVLDRLENLAEQVTGEKAQSLRNQTLTELRARTEQKLGRKLKMVSRFPEIGRGNVMHSDIVDHDTVERAVDNFIKG